jgi:hypothetical protein
MNKELADLSPQFLDHTINAFTSGLCCLTHPIAIVGGKTVCQQHLNELRANYSGSDWLIT